MIVSLLSIFLLLLIIVIVLGAKDEDAIAALPGKLVVGRKDIYDIRFR